MEKEMETNPLVGVWRLIVLAFRYADGRAPEERKGPGYIIYTADGYMSATLSREGRALFGTN